MTLMPQNFNQVRYLIGDSDVVAKMEQVPAFAPFDDSVMDYLNRVSNILLKKPDARLYPDVVTFAFWCRKASVKKMRKNYTDIANRIGRGVVFHIAPANVAVNFAYSLATGFMAGNANVVRLPSNTFPQVDIIADALAQALDDEIKPYICLLRYGHDQAITAQLSAICDTRIIWGGDQTIANIRQSMLKARAMDITFADRYSFCVINADEYLKSKHHNKIAEGFFNDTYLTDQNACTSPRIIVWMGEHIQEAQRSFWGKLHALVKGKYELQPVKAISKYLTFCRHAASSHAIHLEQCQDNLIVRAKLDKLSGIEIDYVGTCGYFLEYEARSFEEILPLCSSRCQTLSYFGFNASLLQDFLMNARPRGVDRIVPIGKTMDFSLVWDGYDLIRSLSRKIVLV